MSHQQGFSCWWSRYTTLFTNLIPLGPDLSSALWRIALRQFFKSGYLMTEARELQEPLDQLEKVSIKLCDFNMSWVLWWQGSWAGLRMQQPCHLSQTASILPESFRCVSPNKQSTGLLKLLLLCSKFLFLQRHVLTRMRSGTQLQLRGHLKLYCATFKIYLRCCAHTHIVLASRCRRYIVACGDWWYMAAGNKNQQTSGDSPGGQTVFLALW